MYVWFLFCVGLGIPLTHPLLQTQGLHGPPNKLRRCREQSEGREDAQMHCVVHHILRERRDLPPVLVRVEPETSRMYSPPQ